MFNNVKSCGVCAEGQLYRIQFTLSLSYLNPLNFELTCQRCDRYQPTNEGQAFFTPRTTRNKLPRARHRFADNADRPFVFRLKSHDNSILPPKPGQQTTGSRVRCLQKQTEEREETSSDDRIPRSLQEHETHQIYHILFPTLQIYFKNKE